MSQLMKSKIGQQTRPYKNGGAVQDDEAADRKLIKKTVKASALTGKKKGGAVCKKCGGKVCKC